MLPQRVQQKGTDAISPISKSDVGREAPKPAITTEGQLAKQPPFAPEPAAPTAGVRTQNAAPSESAKNEAIAKQKEQAQPGVAAARDANNERATQDKDVSDTRSRKAATLGRGGAGIMRRDRRARRLRRNAATKTVRHALSRVAGFTDEATRGLIRLMTTRVPL